MIDYNALYERIEDVRAIDLLGPPRKWEGNVTNITELLFDNEKNKMACRFASAQSVPYEKTSDFERFSLYLSNMPNMAGSGSRALFAEELSLLFGYKGKLDGECVNELWGSAASALECCGYNADRLLERRGISQIDVDGIYEIKLNRSYARSYLDYLDEVAFEMAKMPCDTLYCDISELNFVRTDVYHCEEAYKRYASCRDYNKEQEDMLTCGVLYSVCERLKKENRALWLYVGNNLSCAESMLAYYKDRGVLPRVYVVLSESSAKLGATRLCFDPAISPALAYEMGDTEERIAKKLLELASVYPISLVRYGGIFGTVALPIAAHNMVKRGICKALCEVCDDVDKAYEIFCAIYDNRKHH